LDLLYNGGVKNLILFFALLLPALTLASIERLPLHSHNDYLHKDYLINAYTNQFASIEVDIWSWGGQVKVSHWPWNFRGTLEELYLKPLQKLVEKKQLGDNGLILWVDIKDFRFKTIYQLATVLRRYPMIGKEVRVVLTGNKSLKKKFIQYFPDIKAEHDTDSTARASEDVKWLAVNWKKKFNWNGLGRMPQNEMTKLGTMVEEVHTRGQKIRFYNSPDSVEYWTVVKNAHVDLIDTNKVSKLADFFRSITR
jgi:alkaline phosphatase